MNKCVIVPDSFKGSLSSAEICDVIKSRVLEHYPKCQVISIPIADGGEGTIDCFLHAMPGERVFVTVRGPYGEPISGEYARFGDTAVIETAKAAGLPLVKGRENPSATTTYGVGEMMRHAVQNGCRKLILGLGGSCTNDGGTGMAAALGVRFLDEEGNPFVPTGGTLSRIKCIDTQPAREFLKECSITAMCDVDNPMYGKSGAAYVFATQKGATSEMVRLLDENLRKLSDQIKASLGTDVSTLPGAGAAGAMGAGVVAFLGGRLRSGIRTILDMVHFDELIDGADLIFTGEGKIDGQSLRGKTVIGVAERARAKGVPVVAVVGDVGDDAYAAYGMGVTAIFSINRLAIPFEMAATRSRKDLSDTVNDILRFHKMCCPEKSER